MPSRDSKIITSLHQRRQIEQAIRALSEVTSEEELTRRAREIAEQGEAVLPVLLAMLGTADPQLRGGLARVASALPREKVIPALRAVAGDPSRPDGERMTAMTILERFLGEELGPELFVGLTDPHKLAVASLQEMLSEAVDEPGVLIEYLTQLEEEPVEVALMIVEATAQLDPEQTTDLLRMLSLDPRPPIARAALHRLGSLRTHAALIALQSLLPNLPPALKPVAERGLRKLTLSGVTAPSPEAPSWRALLSPVEGTGNQILWFIRPHDTEPLCTLVGLWLDDQGGLLDAFGRDDIPREQLPGAQPPGTMHLVQVPRKNAITLLLEIPFDAGRQVLADAVTNHLAQGRPLPMLYRFYSQELWSTPWTPTAPSAVEQETESATRSLEDTLQLLDHPAFYTWGVQEPWVYDIAEELSQRAGAWQETTIASRAREIAQRAFPPDALEVLSRRLQRMSRWLALAGEDELSLLARWTAAHLRETPPAAHPFLLRMAEMGLQAAILNLSQGVDPRHSKAED